MPARAEFIRLDFDCAADSAHGVTTAYPQTHGTRDELVLALGACAHPAAFRRTSAAKLARADDVGRFVSTSAWTRDCVRHQLVLS